MDIKTAALRPAEGKSFVDVYTSNITDHMMLQVCDHGLDSCWIESFDPKIIREEFKIRDYLGPINLLTVGYAAEDYESPEKLDQRSNTIDDLVSFDTL